MNNYIVYMGGHDHKVEITESLQQEVSDTHVSLLSSHLGSVEKAKNAMIHSYTKHINGFSARLDEDEARAIAGRPDVISVFPSKMKQLHTTRSWQFMVLEKNGQPLEGSLWSKADYGKDTIIANIDTGVWPESESFNDVAMGPVPSRWKGICQNQTEVSCNKKLIGMRYFSEGYEFGGTYKIPSEQKSPRDFEGHGSHTLSTAAGWFVSNVSIFGYAKGTAEGGSPKAHVAAYKVCFALGCAEDDILAAVDQAIEDGVDVISMSVGGTPVDFSVDGTAIAAFHAMRKGVAMLCSGGNSGPRPATITNTAPWIFTIAASSIDRTFPSMVVLGNGKQYTGESLSTETMPQKPYPMIDSASAALSPEKKFNASLCIPDSLDPEKVKGKVVLCLRGINARVEKGAVVKTAGGIAMILANDESTGIELIADTHLLPASHISYGDGQEIFKYMKSTESPGAYLTKPYTNNGKKPAPVMAAFSSRGPNVIAPDILKPDITAPGVSILAAFSGAQSPSELPIDKRRVPYTVMSGTSMSCPHAAGVVGLLRTLHPDWSPSAIRSALMTSARTRDNDAGVVTDGKTAKKSNAFAYGAGHIRPNRAMDPGLVYDLSMNDYFNYLCQYGYNSTQIQMVAGSDYQCPLEDSNILNFNYPSITIPGLTKKTTVSRKLKNVGPPGTYTVRFHSPAGVKLTVQPTKLTFSKVGEEKMYSMTFTPKGKVHDSNSYTFGRIIWSDGKHYVRSPIVVKKA